VDTVENMEQYTDNEIKLAREIAYTLHDEDSIILFLQFARKYTETHIREVLQKVMAIDESKIKKNRAALFTYLMKQNGKQMYPRN